jgi:hypothetical protein
VTPAEVRGRVKYVVPKMLHHIYGRLFDDGSWWLEDGYAGWVNGEWMKIPILELTTTESERGQLVVYDQNSKKSREETRRSAQFAFSGMLTQRYEWHVALGPDRNGPRILLTTSPAGCRDLFKDRAKSPNRSRREALRHWVMRHYREQSSDHTVTFVRQHLRGATDFNWRDLAGEVLVSAFDLEKNEAFKLEAEHWRAARNHNKFRVRIKRKA